MSAKRLPRGTTQASMPDGESYYVIEKWNGQRWVVQQGITWGSKRDADAYGERVNPGKHKR